MLAFPLMYPSAFLAAAGLPFAGILGATVLLAFRPAETLPSTTTLALAFANWVLFPWLAVRIHRLVLLGDFHDERLKRLRGVASYFAVSVAGGLLFSIFLALVFSRYVPANDRSALADGMVRLPLWLSGSLQLVPLYLLSRLSLMLPRIALGHGWRFRDAWRQSRGNGWRLFAVVLLLPWSFEMLVDLVGRALGAGLISAAFGVVEALLTACGVIALSLAFRELAEPVQPPTNPPD